MNRTEYASGKPKKRVRWDPPYVVNVINPSVGIAMEHGAVLRELAIVTENLTHAGGTNTVRVMLANGHIVDLFKSQIKRVMNLDHKTEEFLIQYFQGLLTTVQKEEQSLADKKASNLKAWAEEFNEKE